MRTGGAVVWLCAGLAGCGIEHVSSSHDPNCTSHYEPVADASTWQALRAELRREVAASVRSVLVVDHKADKRVVNLLNRRQRVVTQVDVWQMADGTWVAQRWAQCID